MEQETKILTDEEVAVIKERLEKNRTVLLNPNNNKKGFRALGKKDKGNLEQKVQDDANLLAVEYLRRYDILSDQFGMELKAVMVSNPNMPNIAQATTQIYPRVKQEPPKTKPWHEAMADNLKVRKECEHVLHAEGLICEKCGLPKQTWGEKGKGVTPEYEKEALDLIEKEKQTEEEAQEETA